MGRWTQYDEDAYRLPEGFTRTSYDADTQRYRYHDNRGATYEGGPRAKYGVLKPVSNSSMSRNSDGKVPSHSRTKAPVSRSQTIPTRYKTTLGQSHNTSTPNLVPSRDILSDGSLQPPPSPQSSHLLASSPLHDSPSIALERESIPNMVRAVRRMTLPKLQSVVYKVMHSVRVSRKGDRHGEADNEKAPPAQP